MKKRKLSLLLSLLCAAICPLCACSAAKNGDIILIEDYRTQAEQKQIGFFGYKADTLNLIAIEDALHGFMDEHEDVNIIYEGLKGTDYWSAFDKRVSAGVLDDMFMMDHDHIVSLGKENKLADLTDALDFDAFNDMVRSQIISENGEILFVPTCISAYGLYVNYDLLSENGLKVPENFSEFKTACDYFVSKGVTPLILNNFSSMRSLIIAKGMYDVYQSDNTAQLIKEFNADPVKLAPYLKSGVDMAAQMIEDGWIDCAETLVTTQTSGDLAAFAKGDRPFMITGGWATVRVKDANPNLNYGVYPYPVNDNGSVLVMDVGTCISVNAESKYKEEAKAVISHFTKPDVLWNYCESQSSFMPIKDSRIPSDETISHIVPYITNGESVIGSDYNFTMTLDKYLISCGTGLLKGLSAEQANGYLVKCLEEGMSDKEADEYLDVLLGGKGID